MAAEADLALLVADTPTGAQAALQIRPAAALGDVGLGEEGGLRVAGSGREHRHLDAEPHRAASATRAPIRSWGIQSQRLPAPANSGIPMLASEEGLISTIGGASCPTNSVEPPALEHGKGATKPDKRKGAPAGGRLLAAEDVHVELAGELPAGEVGDQGA